MLKLIHNSEIDHTRNLRGGFLAASPQNRVTTPIIKANNDMIEKILVNNTWAEGEGNIKI